MRANRDKIYLAPEDRMSVAETEELSVVHAYSKGLKRRFPPEAQRRPTNADMRMVRELLTAAGGNIEELSGWAEAVRDTDDDAAALDAYSARLEFRVLESLARLASGIEAARQQRQKAALAASLQEILAEPKRPGPHHDRYLDVDREIILAVEVQLAGRLPAGAFIKRIIRQAVRDNWGPALGHSVEAATARIFGRLRRRRVKGGTILPDVISPLSKLIKPRKPRKRS